MDKYFSPTDLQYYFQVNHQYVRNKLKLILFPFLHRVRRDSGQLVSTLLLSAGSAQHPELSVSAAGTRLEHAAHIS